MENCVFCKIAKGEISCWKVYEDENSIAFLDLDPVSEYHTLVIPKNHYQDILDIPEGELKELISSVQKVCLLYQEKLGITNVQLFNNSGRDAQQSVFHIHFHIIPRSHADGNNVYLNKHPELMAKYDRMLEKLK
ncbi:MAG: HIT family protein [Anaerolineaceae bacterium]